MRHAASGIANLAANGSDNLASPIPASRDGPDKKLLSYEASQQGTGYRPAAGAPIPALASQLRGFEAS